MATTTGTAEWSYTAEGVEWIGSPTTADWTTTTVTPGTDTIVIKNLIPATWVPSDGTRIDVLEAKVEQLEEYVLKLIGIIEARDGK